MMSRLKTSVQNRPLVWYYAISVFLVVLLIPPLIASSGTLSAAFERAGVPFNTDLVTALRLVVAVPAAFFGVGVALLQVATPDLAVLAVAKLGLGDGVLRDLRHRFRFWRGVSWRRGLLIWGACVLTFCLMNLATAGLNTLVFSSRDFQWSVNFLSWPFLAALLIAMFLDAGALFEENGWRGFALPRLQARHGPLLGTAILGVLWSGWHMPVKIDLALTFGWGHFFGLFAVLSVKFVLLSLVITYFWNLLGQTTVIAIVMHGLSNDSVRLGGELLGDSLRLNYLSEVTLIAPLLVVSVVLLVLSKGRLGQLSGAEGEGRGTPERRL